MFYALTAVLAYVAGVLTHNKVKKFLDRALGRF